MSSNPNPPVVAESDLWGGDGWLSQAPYGPFAEVLLRFRYEPRFAPLTNFYVPLLSRSVLYDRAVGYFSATEMRYAAQGMARFVAGGGSMRLIVGAHLTQEDVDTVLSGSPLEEALVAALLRDPGLNGAQIVADHHLALTAWLVKEGRLQIKVGVPLSRSGRPLRYEECGRYFHTKIGILTDAVGNKVAFEGSNNETPAGWQANHETFSVFASWDMAWGRYGASIDANFSRLWDGDPDEGWLVLDLPDAVRQHLVSSVPPDFKVPVRDPDEVAEPVEEREPEFDVEAALADLRDLADLPRNHPFTAALTAPVQPLPHQLHALHRAVTTYPRGYLFASEVGLGKTIEVGETCRELLLTGQAESALILVPASVLRQWQEELQEKIGLSVPRYEQGRFWTVPGRNDDGTPNIGDEVPVPPGTNPWSAFPVVLASSHLARRRARRDQVIAAGPWDIVVVDEAHHARRRGSKATDTPNSLLRLLQSMRDAKSWKALYLATATPMQMNAFEAWDLIELLGLPGRWGSSAADFVSYYTQLRNEPAGRAWGLLERMLADYFSDPAAERDGALEARAKTALGAVRARAITRLDSQPMAPEKAKSLSPEEVGYADVWLRRHTPMRDRVFRSTRQTLRAYQAAGIIAPDVVIPYRHVEDEFIGLDPWERHLYDRIEDYIRRHYNAYMSDKSTQGLGFIMTVYRRRLTSSFHAIRESLRRRLNALESGATLAELLTDDDQAAIQDDTLFEVDDLDTKIDLLRGEIDELRDFITALSAIQGEDSKATRLVHDLAAALASYSSVVVFTQYTDTMDYVRERLLAAGHTRLGCYSGRGGELWNPATEHWDAVTKSEIKTRFTTGELSVLIGTDSMSEGLNLQTSGRLINYDMPWNLMRVEQRIGRVDRIGAAYENIRVSNYFYADTVEEAVYKGIKEDYGDFTDIVGNAQPVLGTIEQAIEQLALSDTSDDRAQAVGQALAHIRSDIQEIEKQAIRASDLGDQPVEAVVDVTPPPELEPAITLAGLRDRLLANPLSGPRLREVNRLSGIYLLLAENRGDDDYGGLTQGEMVTFDPDLYALDPDALSLVTYGQTSMASLLSSGSSSIVNP